METVKAVCSALYGAGIPLLCALAVWNIAVFCLYGADKTRAVKKKRRIRESVLLFCAFFFGSLGAFSGMNVFHHKTRKWYFFIPVPLFFVLHILITGLICRFGR